MSSLFGHIFIPLVILLIFSDKLKLDQKKIIILSFISILPDADAFIFIHRAFLHNIFVLLIVPLLIFVIIKDIKIYGIISFYLMSHLILDIFNGGIFLFYPLYDNVFFSRIEVWFNNGYMIYVLNYGISEKIVSMGIGEPMISSENIGTTILLIIIMLLSIITSKYKKIQEV